MAQIAATLEKEGLYYIAKEDSTKDSVISFQNRQWKYATKFPPNLLQERKIKRKL